MVVCGNIGTACLTP
ncbi:DUF3265 domain-containing protein [Vibrio vulnificus]|nr:DUF3265 domain-containing protein [Vibrio vulnificus]